MKEMKKAIQTFATISIIASVLSGLVWALVATKKADDQRDARSTTTLEWIKVPDDRTEEGDPIYQDRIRAITNRDGAERVYIYDPHLYTDIKSFKWGKFRIDAPWEQHIYLYNLNMKEYMDFIEEPKDGTLNSTPNPFIEE